MAGRGPTIATVVCANGLGHLRRTTEILSRVLDQAPQSSVALVCEEWQRARGRDIPAVSRLEASDKVSWVHGVMAPGVAWSSDPGIYADGRLMAWVDRLEQSGALDGADMVLSDNLPGVLALRPNAVLLGSFLWAPVLEAAYPREPAVVAYSAQECELLGRHTPPMLCVAGFAMPEVLQRTLAVELPWMCPTVELAETGERPKDRVVALGGATGAADACLSRAADAPDSACGWKLAVPAPWIEDGRPQEDRVPFRYGAEEFSACAAALCRPAMGTIHECIAYGIPMACLHEPGNAEMAHNGRCVEKAGLGVYLGEDPSGDEVRAAIENLSRGALRAAVLQRMREGGKDGYDRAAEWILKKLEAGGCKRD